LRKTWGRIVMLATLGLLVVPGASAHASGFGRARTVSSPVKEILHPPSVAVNASGRTAVAWVEFGKQGSRVHVRRGRITGKLGPAQTLSRTRTRPVYEVNAAIGADGTTTAIWLAGGVRGNRLLQVALARPGRRFGKAQTLVRVRANIGAGSVTVGPTGQVLAVWAQGVPETGGHEVRYALSRRNEAFGRPRSLAPTSLSSTVSVAAGADGAVFVTWATPIGQRNQQAAVAVLPAGATELGPPQAVSGLVGVEATPNAEAEAPTLFAGGGRVALSYGVGGVQPNLLQVASATLDGHFGSPRTAGSVDVSNGAYKGPFVALPAAAPTVAVWSVSRVDNPESERLIASDVEAAAQRPDGSFESATRLSTPGALGQAPAAAEAGNTALAVWGEGPYSRLRLRYSSRTPSGPFTPAAALAHGFSYREPVLASAGRYAAAAWIARLSHARRSVRVATFEAD
jgi:hypothetical protein